MHDQRDHEHEGTLVTREAASEAESVAARADALLSSGRVRELLRPAVSRELADGGVDRERQIFVNRNLRMDHIRLVGFDMDYTLALYHPERIEGLSFNLTLAKLVTHYGYPPEIALLTYDPAFVIRGLAVDRREGNILKMDRYGYVGRAYRGLRRLDKEAHRRLYRHERVDLKDARYAWLDTLFALPEAYLYAGIVELLEGQGRHVDPSKLFDDIREAIDEVHRDGSLKAVLKRSIAYYVQKDPELGPALHKLRSTGKRLFLLTNSYWPYTRAVMEYLLDDALPAYPSWRSYFDVVVTGASKPGFFAEGKPFLEVDPETGRTLGEATSLERHAVYQGGNLADLERFTGFRGEDILYVGDHIFGDILRSKKTAAWRTCMVVQELEDELRYVDGRGEDVRRLAATELIRARLDDELNLRKVTSSGSSSVTSSGPSSVTEPEQAKREAREALELLRQAHAEAVAVGRDLERELEEGFNAYWGLLFKEGHENSRFGEQVERYACIYTSRASNFVLYSPQQYFRSPRALMPHEQTGGLPPLTPVGEEGPAPGDD